MKMKHVTLAILVVFLALPAPELFAGRGGGRLGGGGTRMASGGARMGSGARPNFSGHAPSMSRATPSMNRSNFNRPNVSRPNISRPNVSLPNVSRPNSSRPNVSRPSTSRPAPGGITGGANRPSFGGVNRPNIGSGSRPNIGGANGPTFGSKRPSMGQLDDFLGMPGGSNRPTTLPGNLPGKRPGGLASERPNTLPGNVGQTRPARPARPKVGDIQNKLNTGDRNIGDRVGNIGSRDININAGNQINVGNRVGNNNVSSIRNRWSNNVNRPFGNGNYWDPGYSRNPAAWRWQHGWHRYPPNWCWRAGSWATVGTFFAWSWVTPTPIVYDYGTSVVYRDNYVYVRDQQVATADEYYEQASTIAESVPEKADPETTEWMPLGVFAISADEATDTGLLIQLAVSKEGIIAGTFYNETTNTSRPIEGTVDRETQRAAWKFSDGKNEDVVMETVIHNLTEDESTALVHFGADKQESWTMVRIEEPTE